MTLQIARERQSAAAAAEADVGHHHVGLKLDCGTQRIARSGCLNGADAPLLQQFRVHLPLVASCVDKQDPCGRWHLPRLVLLAPRLNSGKPLSRSAVERHSVGMTTSLARARLPQMFSGPIEESWLPAHEMLRIRLMHVLMRPIVSILGACALLSCVADGIGAQEPELFRGSPAELVVLSVVVNDRRGREVPHLTREQFTVYDNNLPQPIALFDSGDEPVSVVLLIDVSGSMRPKLGEIVIATLAFARASNPADELYTIAFNEQVMESAGGRSIHAADAVQLESELRTLRAEGQTALYDGLNVGLDRLEHATQTRRILLLISDGGDNASKTALGDVLARAKRASVAIYTIGLFDKGAADQNPKVLKSLAQATGGQRYLPSSPSALLGICERIAREIRSGYTIAFTPPMPDGLYHELRVVVSPGPDRLVARTRPGYTAASVGRRDRDVR